MQADLGVWDRGGVLSAQVSSLIGKGGAHVGWAGCAALTCLVRCALAKSAALVRTGHMKCARAQAKSGAPAHFNRHFVAIRRRSALFPIFLARILGRKPLMQKKCEQTRNGNDQNKLRIFAIRSFKARAEPPTDPIDSKFCEVG